MYGNDFTNSMANLEQKGFFAARRARRIETVKAQVMEQHRRYESIKTTYNWSGKKHAFVVHDDYCEIDGFEFGYDDKTTPDAVVDFVDCCERKAARHYAKQLKQEQLRSLHVSLYGDLERRVLALGGKFKYTEDGVKVVLPESQEIGSVDEFFIEYNDYDKTFLEERVLRCEQAHQERLFFIASHS